MRISDWSSDVCSSDLDWDFDGQPVKEGVVQLDDSGDTPSADLPLARSVPLKLDANGSATTSVTVDQPITEPTLMAAAMDYEDANGETLTSSRRITPYPSAARLGLTTAGWNIGRAPVRERACQEV